MFNPSRMHEPARYFKWAPAPSALREFYLQLVEIEAAFRTLKGDLTIRPVFHHEQNRIEAHVFIASLAYCVRVTLGLRPLQLPALDRKSGQFMCYRTGQSKNPRQILSPG